jgi:hypothetical protein
VGGMDGSGYRIFLLAVMKMSDAQEGSAVR